MDPTTCKYRTHDGSLVVRLNKAVYGTADAGKLWHDTLSTLLKELGFKKSNHDSALYYKRVDGKLVFTILYVDDVLAGGSKDELEKLTEAIGSRYKVKKTTISPNTLDFVGVRISKNDRDQSFSLSQTGHIAKLASRVPEEERNAKISMGGGPNYNKETDPTLLDADEAKEYKSLVMGVQYVKRTRYDVSAELAYLTTRVQGPTRGDWKKLVRLINFLSNTRHAALRFKPTEGMQVFCSADASYASFDDYKSQTGFYTSIGKHNAPVYVKAGKQATTAQSTTMAELIALASAVEECTWTRGLMEELGFEQESIKIEQDNRGLVYLLQTEGSGAGRTKWTSIKLFWVREQMNAGLVHVEWTPTDVIRADGLTKVLPRGKYMTWRKWILNLKGGA
jgi:hypothetical protein